MRRTPRSVKVLALLLGLGMFAAACGDDSGSSSNTTGGGAGTTASGGSAGTTAAAADRTPTGGTITIGAEQWPECINPITQCANSSWDAVDDQSPTMAGPWFTTNDGNYKATVAARRRADARQRRHHPEPVHDHVQDQPGRGLGRRLADHVEGLRLHVAREHRHRGFAQHAGYDQIDSIDTTDPATAVVKFKANYAAYKNLFYPL